MESGCWVGESVFDELVFGGLVVGGFSKTRYEDGENKIMMTNITMKISFPSVFIMNLCSYQTSK